MGILPNNWRTLGWFAWPLVLIAGILLWKNTGVDGKNRAGKRLYELHCANCHMEKGQGLRKLIPGIRESVFLTDRREELACWIRKGSAMKIDSSSSLQVMPANELLSPVEIVGIVNFLSQNWGGLETPVNFTEVSSWLEECQ